MKPAQISTGYYKDSLAQKKRRSLLFKIWLILGILVAVTLIFFYLVLFLDAYQIKGINVDNIPSIYQAEAKGAVEKIIEQRTWKYFRLQRSILFFDEEESSVILEKHLPALKDLAIFKEYPDQVIVRGVERVPDGIWCLKEDCSYFDESGQTWGRAAKSSGFLILSVEDQRDGKSEIDPEFFKGIREVAGLIDRTGLAIKDLIIPHDSVNEFQAITSKGYRVYFSLDSDLPSQIEVFRVFLDQKGSDFQPQYVDLRIDGRVYYR